MYKQYKGPAKLAIRRSRIPGGGLGVFATAPIRKGELLEVCPFIEVPKTVVFGYENNLLQNYVFTSHNDPMMSLIVFGYGSMYNHSLDKFNVVYRINASNRKRFLDFIARYDIPAGTELFINYGPGHQANH